jgi:chemotaxis protein MotB
MEENDCPECQEPAGWIMTFADLMSLLMCFFVLLLSFSEMDLLKFKQVAGSMQFAFGVQREIKANEIPKGTSVIAKEFSPGRPQPTTIKEVRQVTTDEFKQNLEFGNAKNNQSSTHKDKLLEQLKKQLASKSEDQIKDIQEALRPASLEELKRGLAAKAQEKAEEIKRALKNEISDGLVEVFAHLDQVIIRIREKGSFASGSSAMQKAFQPVMQRVSRALNTIRGKILVAGHTDNVPIHTIQFPSNWVLSAARAASVVHFMTSKGRVSPRRVEIRAHAAMSPITSNKSLRGRARNRRVEIVVLSDEKTVAAIKAKLKK